MNLTELMDHAFTVKASDIHISSSHPPIVRINGEITQLRVPALKESEVKAMIYSIMNDKQKDCYEKFMEIDFAIHFNGRRFRINAFNTINGASAALRIIENNIKNLEEINAPDIFINFTKLSKGIILITGPTGSGKSTTVASILNYINKNYHRHILTIEDPIEFVYKSEKSLINQREIGIHSESFSKALKSALREDPDIIMIGELRDLETIQLALTAAETGHLVISTLHTNSASQTINRIIDVFPPANKEIVRSMLSSSIEGIISQRLIKKLDDSGRVPVYEVLIATPAVRNLIREAKIPQIQSLMQINSKIGMKLMKDSVNELLTSGTISLDSAKHILNIAEIERGESSNDRF